MSVGRLDPPWREGLDDSDDVGADLTQLRETHARLFPAVGDLEANSESGRTLLDGLDPGIAPYVEVLREAGIETFESCEGGPGHCYSEPTIRFYGHRDEGFRAFAAVVERGLPVSDLRRTWPILDGEPTGPYWEIVFRERAC